MYNPDNKQTFWYADDLNMISTQSVTKIYDDGHYDGIEKALHAFIAYGDRRFIYGIESCWRWEGEKFVGKRYPDFLWNDAGISRDHTIYSFVAWKLKNYQNQHLYYRAKSLPFMLGNKIGLTMTPSLWLWL